jgi:hypothetical protein
MSEESDFQITGREPLMWLEQARRLKEAADAVGAKSPDAIERFQRNDRERMFIVYPFPMLAGMAIENLLKGILVGRNPEVVQRDRLNAREWHRGEHPHDLRHLARLAGVILTEDEEDLLVRMSEAVLWNGRYPVPKKSLRLEKTTRRGGAEKSRRTFITSDPRLFEGLYGRLAADLRVEGEKAEQRRREEDYKWMDEGFSGEGRADGA